MGYLLGYLLGYQRGWPLGYLGRFQMPGLSERRLLGRRRTRRATRPILASAACEAGRAPYRDWRSAVLAETSSSPNTSLISAASLRKAKLAADSAFVSTTAWSVAVASPTATARGMVVWNTKSSVNFSITFERILLSRF